MGGRRDVRLAAPGHANGFGYAGTNAGMAGLEARSTLGRKSGQATKNDDLPHPATI